jgi:hypothetical protein
MESSTEHILGEDVGLPAPVLQARPAHAFDVTADLYAKSELEERLRRIDRSIEKAREDA